MTIADYGDLVWIEDLDCCGLVVDILYDDAGPVYVCQLHDGAVGGWAAVPAEKAVVTLDGRPPMTRGNEAPP